MNTVDLRVLGNGSYQLLNPVFFSAEGWNIRVYHGFIWDMASIPHILWEEVGCPTDFAFESLIHDAIYRTRLLDRKTADKIFYRALIYQGVDTMKAKAMYLGVRLGGDSSYGVGDIAYNRQYVQIDSKLGDSYD